MRKNLRYVSVFFGTLFIISALQAQDRFAYTVTDVNPNSAGWSVLRKLDLKTGQFSNVILNGIDASQTVFDATTKKPILNFADARFGNYQQLPFSTGVAAIAFDKKNNRLYYTPMFIDQLRYVDLKTMKVYYIADQPFTKLGNMHNDEAKIVTRMVIAPDGYGYALTNDANTFIRFTTGKKVKIEQLGPLVDDPANTGISIHNRCSSWGGDVVADDAGNLYFFSAHNNVFKINIETKVATWLGPVKDLPANFTINGAAVNDEQKLLVGSQTYAQNWYVVDTKNWTASEYKSAGNVYLTSDLANSNYLSTTKNATTEIATIALREAPLTSKIQLYPNPVSNNEFRLQFATAGNYNLVLTDVAGKQVLQQKINIGSDGQTQTINLNRNTAKGFYLVNVTDVNNQIVFTQKLVVQ